MNRETLKEVKAMLKDFNSYFSYMHGKSEAVDMAVPDAAIAVWAKVYESLTPDERKAAKERIYESHNFHPTPQQFKEAVRGTEDGEALGQWIIVLDALRMNSDDARVRIEFCNQYARRALKTVGGLGSLGQAYESALHSSIKNSFVSAYKHIKTAMEIVPEQENRAQYASKPSKTPDDKQIDVSGAISGLTRSLSM